MIQNGVSLAQLLEFEVVFPGEKPLKPEEYLAGGGRNVILKVAAFFLGFKANKSKHTNRSLLENIPPVWRKVCHESKSK